MGLTLPSIDFNALNSFLDSLTGTLNKVNNLFGGVSTVIGGASGIATSMVNAIGAPIQALMSQGAQIVGGFTGVTNQMGNLYLSVGSWFSSQSLPYIAAAIATVAAFVLIPPGKYSLAAPAIGLATFAITAKAVGWF